MALDPSTPHPAYAQLSAGYQICLDAYNGHVRHYIPRLEGQTDAEYELYTSRAGYYNVVDKTLNALVGALTRKPYSIEGLDAFPENAYGNGDVFLQNIYKDIMLGARSCILVDADEMGMPYLVNFNANDIVNWGPNFVMIKQTELVRDQDNPYLLVENVSYRELYLDSAGIYQARIWTQGGRGKTWTPEMLDTFLVNGQPLNYIPLWAITPYDVSWNVYRSPLMTQSSLNIQHFRLSCDIAHYGHFMAIPTFVLEGSMQQYTDINGNVTEAKIRLGSTSYAMHITPGSKAYYAEVSGASYKMLQDELDNIEGRMISAGTKLLSSKRGIESVEALRLRSGAETAQLETIVNAVEAALDSALKLCAEMMRLPTENTGIWLNKDFTAEPLDPGLVKSLLDLYTANTITLDQLLNELYKGEIVDPTGSAANQTDSAEVDGV